jgi:hypothetical protein
MAINRKYQGFKEAFNGKNKTDQGPISRVRPDASLANISGLSDKDFSPWNLRLGQVIFKRI